MLRCKSQRAALRGPVCEGFNAVLVAAAVAAVLALICVLCLRCFIKFLVKLYRKFLFCVRSCSSEGVVSGVGIGFARSLKLF